mmetsp:Transcript_38241/g.109803  ORF Transcript_38241/g.109803 Transcript_38241/m.109803 type:complete len:147 (+) Transcript_38241:74-514(+)
MVMGPLPRHIGSRLALAGLALGLLASRATAACPVLYPGAAAGGQPTLRKLVGGSSAPQLPDDSVRQLLVEADATNELFKYCEGQGYGLFVAAQPCSYTTQVVAGMIYTVSMSTEPDPGTYYEIKIFKPLPHLEQKARVTEIRMAQR